MNDRDDFDKWVGQWEKAQADGLFKDQRPPVPSEQQQANDFFGNYRPASTPLKDVDAQYWNSVYRMSKGEEEEHDPAMTGSGPAIISEDAPVGGKHDFKLSPTTKPDGKTTAQVTDDLGGLANPVQYPTRGKDANNRVTPDWAGGKELIELHKMKEQLHRLESKVAADPRVENKGTKKVLGQIDALWKQIDELSDTLNPDFVKEYLS